MDPDALVLNKREKTNSLLNTLFVRLEYDQCMKLIDELGNDTNEENEYALYIKALILRSKHKINQSLEIFKRCHMLNPTNAEYLKQFARSLYLLGRHKNAIDLFVDCEELSPNDWEIHYNKGLCHRYSRNY